jgi:hypothetical protein
MLVALEAHNQEPNNLQDWVKPPLPSKKTPEAYTIMRASL